MALSYSNVSRESLEGLELEELGWASEGKAKIGIPSILYTQAIAFATVFPVALSRRPIAA